MTDRGPTSTPSPPDPSTPPSATPAPLPQTWRLRRAAAVPVAVAVVLTVTCAAVWVAVPAEVRRDFSWPQLATTVFCLLLAIATLVAMAASRVTATEDALVVVNGYRARRIPWHLVVGMRYRPDDPWPVLRLADDVQVGVLGIQSADGPRARVNAGELADVIVARTGG